MKNKNVDKRSRQFTSKPIDKQIALSRFASGLSLYKHQGLYVWALLERALRGEIFLEQYAPQRQMHVIEQYYRAAIALKKRKKGPVKKYKVRGKLIKYDNKKQQ